MQGIVIFKDIRILECFRRFSEANFVLGKIYKRLFSVPFESHSEDLSPRNLRFSLVRYSQECTATRGISLPSPPSAGVNTFNGSGQATGGMLSGP